MIHDIFMPALSSTMTEGKIVSWVKSPGDKVAKGETVLVVESDKADMDVESFYDGYLATIIVEAGQQAPVGAAIALVAETEAEIALAKEKAKSLTGGTPSPAPAPVKEETPIPAPVAATKASGNGRTVVSPRARKLAKELGVEVTNLQGSGPYGRIVTEDIEKAAGKTTTVAQATPTIIAAPPTPQATPKVIAPVAVAVTLGETVAFNTLQQAVVRNMVASLQVPTFHVSYTITTEALDKLYQQIKSKGVTMTALLIKAVAMTLQKHPLVNAGYTEAGIRYNSGINVSVAVAMPNGGLITPVVANADKLDIYSLSRTWKDLVDRARAKQLQPQEYNSGTFTISNLGMYGVESFDAILPPGQGAILAVGGAKPTVVATEDGAIAVRRQMNVNITSDHRIIYGADAASFLQDLGKLIETGTASLTL